MLKRIILLLVVMVSGLLTGYYSEPVYDFIWSGREVTPAGSVGVEGRKDGAGSAGETSPGYISAEEAVSAVKKISWVDNLIRVSELDGTTLAFETDREPAADYPIWLVEVTERFPDRVPETRYFQVDAGSGRVLDVQEKDLKISGIGLGMTRNEVKETAGSPGRTKRKWDNGVRQTLRTDSYEGMEVVYDKDDIVVRVAATDQGLPGPGGVEVYDSREDVLRKLGKAGTVQTNMLIYPVLGQENYKLFLDFNGEGRVTAVTISSGLLD